jgi:hypothetical protein
VAYIRVRHLDLGLGGGPRGDGVHQRRGQSIVGLKPKVLELRADLVGFLSGEALLNDGRDKGSELRLLPALFVGELDVDKVKTFEGVLLLDAAKHVDATVAAGVSLNSSALVDDSELVSIGGDLELVAGDDSNDGEESTLRLPALGAATGVVVSDLTVEGDLNGVGGALASELTTREAGRALGDALVDAGVEVVRHFVGCIRFID